MINTSHIGGTSKIPNSLFWELILSYEYGLLIMYQSTKNAQFSVSSWEEITMALFDKHVSFMVSQNFQMRSMNLLQARLFLVLFLANKNGEITAALFNLLCAVCPLFKAAWSASL